MKEKGGKRPYTLERMGKTGCIGPQCRRKGFPNFVDLAAIEGEKVDPLHRWVMRWIRESFSRFWY